MKIVLLSGSPKDERSVTLQVGKFLEKISEFSTKDEFTEFLIGNGKFTPEIGEKIKEADLVMFCSSLFHACVPRQMITFLDAMEEQIGKDIQGKPVTYFTTSSQIMDQSAHGYMQRALTRIGLNYIRGLSLLDVDILTPRGQEEAGNWFHYVRSYALRQTEKFKDENSRVVLLDATNGQNAELNAEIENAKNYFESVGTKDIVHVKLREYDIKPCTACVYCYSQKDCINKDDFNSVCEMVYKHTDIILAFAELKDGLLGELYKGWLDRHVKFGLYPHNDEIIFAYMLDTSNATEADRIGCDIHKTEIINFGRDYFAGSCSVDDRDAVEKYYQDLVKIYNYELYPQRNFYSRGSDFIFKDVAWKIQRVAPRNFEYFNNTGNGYKLEPLDINIQGFSDYKGAIESSKKRLTPYKMLLASITEDPSLKTRRRIHNRWNEEKSIQVVEKKESFFTKILNFFKGL